MPYGIQQPAISAQILQLEDALGVTLFHRRPFKLTREGEELFRHIAPFFGGLTEVGNRLRGGTEKRLRIAAPEIVQRDYLPALLVRMRQRIPGFQFTLSPGRNDDIESKLLGQEIDIGFASLNTRRQEDLRSEPLLSLPPILLVPQNSRFARAEDILRRDRIDLPLITLPSADPLCRLFQECLRKRKVDWYASLEVSSLDIISRYVAEGFGIGLSLATPRQVSGDRVRALPLDGFPAVEFGALWLGRLSPPGQIMLEEARAEARTSTRER